MQPVSVVLVHSSKSTLLCMVFVVVVFSREEREGIPSQRGHPSGYGCYRQCRFIHTVSSCYTVVIIMLIMLY